MADFFFGFDATLANSSSEDGLDCPLEEDDIGEEEEYDALNDETFGSEATIGDWEKDHEKLAEITESSRPHNQSTSSKKNGVSSDIEDNLSHLVLDEKEGIVPRPGVWDSPTNLSLPKPLSRPLSLTSALTNVKTVEELEKDLIGNRPPPGLVKNAQLQQQQSNESHLLDCVSKPRFPPGWNILPPHPVVLPPNMRFPHPQLVQPPRFMPNQTGNVLRYPIPPHLLLPHVAQRPPIHGSFCNNFPQPPHSTLGPHLFIRPEHGMVPSFPNSQTSHQQQQQHSFNHLGNLRLPNRPFLHGDQQGNHQPFFKNNQHHRIHDRNFPRQYPYHHHQGMNGAINSGESDEYAGFMSNREKQFLINIQLLQLNTNEPYVDDYYYIVFCDRRNKQSANQAQKDKQNSNNNNNNGYHRDTRGRDQTTYPVLSRSAYIPAQFENSLGKLQFASVIAPRKVIDMDVVPNSDPQSVTQMQQKDTKRTRQLLLEIERLYVLQLQLEDLNNPLALLSEQQSQEAESEATTNTTTIVKKTGPELISTLLQSLLQLMQDDKLTSMLSIRKGKMLLLRFLPYLNVTEHHNQLEELWNAILRGLAIIGRRDSHLLETFYSEFQRWFDTVHEFGAILRLARSLSESASQSSKNNSLAFALTNKFGVSVIASMLEQAENLTLYDDSLSTEWSSFVASIIEINGETPPRVAPYQPMAANTLNQHLNRLSNLKSESYTTLELLLTDANPSR